MRVPSNCGIHLCICNYIELNLAQTLENLWLQKGLALSVFSTQIWPNLTAKEKNKNGVCSQYDSNGNRYDGGIELHSGKTQANDQDRYVLAETIIVVQVALRDKLLEE